MATTTPKNYKRYVLSLLQNQAGNVEGINASEFFAAVSEETGLNIQTIEQMIREHTGQIWKNAGRIYVIRDAFLFSETSRAYKIPETRQGDGIRNGMKTQWEWKRNSKKES
jgi:hypothetical protein